MMKKMALILVVLGITIGTKGAFASLIGDTVSVDKRYENTVSSTRAATVSSGIEIFNWQSLYFDFYDYGVKMIPGSSIAYFGTGFNGFDFYDLDFGTGNEIISSVEAHFVSILDGSIYPLDPGRLSFNDHSFSLNLAGTGFGSHPLYVNITTKAFNVLEPASTMLFLLGALILIIFRYSSIRKYITSALNPLASRAATPQSGAL